MNKLLESVRFKELDSKHISDISQYTKIQQLRQMKINHSPIQVSQKLLEKQQDPIQYAQTYRKVFKFSQTQQWQPIQHNVDETNAVSVMENSKSIEESQVPNTRRKFQLKGRVQKQGDLSQQQILKSLTKNITKITLQFNNDLSKQDYSVILKYDDASNQLEWKKCDKNKQIVWDCQIKFNLSDDTQLYIIIVQQNEKKIQQNVSQQQFDLNKSENQISRDIELKYLKTIGNVKLMIDIQ